MAADLWLAVAVTLKFGCKELHEYVVCSAVYAGDQRVVPVQDADQVVAHIPDEDLDLVCYKMCSRYVLSALFEKVGDDAENVLLRSMRRLASSPWAAGLVDQMFEHYLLCFFLPRGGSVMVARFDQGEQAVLAQS